MVGTHRVGILVVDGYQGLDLVGPFEVFAGASQALSLSGSPDRYEVVLLGTDPDAASETGLRIGPIWSPEEAGPIDTLVLPGGRGIRRAAADPATVDLVRHLGATAGRVASVCTGAFLLAGAGLVGDHPVATHWAYAEQLAAAHPGLRVDGDAIHRHDGRIWSSAGVTAGIDLALAMVEADHGAELAHLVGCWLVVFLRRPGGQRQFARAAAGPPARHPGVAAAQRHVDAHLDGDLRVESLADAAAMSQRHFARTFRAHVGLTPAAYVQQRRLEAARDLLEASDLPLAAIAGRCGLGSVETLRRVMQEQVGVPPETYRTRFSRAST